MKKLTRETPIEVDVTEKDKNDINALNDKIESQNAIISNINSMLKALVFKK